MENSHEQAEIKTRCARVTTSLRGKTPRDADNLAHHFKVADVEDKRGCLFLLAALAGLARLAGLHRLRGLAGLHGLLHRTTLHSHFEWFVFC